MKLKKSIFLFAAAVLLALCGCSKQIAPALVNGGFDEGLSGWNQKIYSGEGADIVLSSDPEHGSVARITAGSDDDVRLVQELSVSGNTYYRISCDVKTENVVGGAGANIGVYGIAVHSSPVTGSSDWQKIELVGRTADGQKTLPVSVGVGGHGEVSSGTAWFDNITVEKLSSAPGDAVILGETRQSSSSSSDEEKVPTSFPTTGIVAASLIATVFMLLIYLWHLLKARRPRNLQAKEPVAAVILILLGALAARVLLSFIFYGHKTDINCFIFWGKRLVSDGPAHFYDGWCDYPPGYMLVLGAMSRLNDLLGNGSMDINSLFIKLPCILADLSCAYLVYRYARKTMNRGAALALLTLVAFTPVMAFVSSAWGQIDQALTLTLIVPILLLYNRKPILAGLLYGVGIIMKPQALMCGPLFAAAYFMYIIFDNPYKPAKSTVGRRILETVLAVAAALAVIIIVSIPFRGSQGRFWLLEKYYGTATSYEYASVNAYNFWALIGANWKKVDVPFMGLTYGKWGTIAMAASVIAGIALYVFAVIKHRRCKGALPLTMAFMLSGIFTFGHFMHERYIFPALMLLMFAYIFYNDKRILWTYLAYAATMLVNCIAAFYYSKLFDYGLYWDERIIFWCSLVNVILFVWFAYLTIDLVVRNKPMRGYNG